MIVKVTIAAPAVVKVNGSPAPAVVKVNNVVPKKVNVIITKGPKGDAGTLSNQTVELVAGEVISGGKAVIINVDGKVYVYDITNENHYGKSCGIAKQAALAGEALEVFTGGVAYEAGSGWLAGIIYYVSATGILTTVAPAAGLIKIMGVGVGADKVLLNGVLELITI